MSMPSRTYKMRIAVYETTQGCPAGSVVISGDTYSMFTKPYVQLKRIGDRLGFIPRDNVGNGRVGIVAVRPDKFQFTFSAAVEKLREFCGEYDTVNVTDNGVVFIRLADRKDYTRTTSGTKGCFHSKKQEPKKPEEPVEDIQQEEPVPETPVVETQIPFDDNGLEKNLLSAIKDMQEAVDEFTRQKREAEQLIEFYQKKLTAYSAALDALRST